MKQTENIYKSIPFWSWNGELDEKELLKQVEWMHQQGMGGFFMHARAGLQTKYLGTKWFDCIKACAEKAQELDMEAYAYDENGWPSGFVGGKLLEDIENHDRYLTYKIGKYDENALVSYDITGEKLVRINISCARCLNVYEHYSTSTVDILNPEVVDKFLAFTHEEYKKRDTYQLKGFFTDEPQYYRWGVPYTKVLAPYFQSQYGEDILDGLGLLFLKKSGYRAFRYKFWKALQNLMLENFAKKVFNWCDKYGYKLTGHYIEETTLGMQMWCCGGVMPFYEYEHIPGIDYLGADIRNELAAKQVSSVAAQLGKKQVLIEAYACCGWEVSPLELKKLTEAEFVSGVNLICPHLVPYAEYGQRKRDCPAHYSPVNPWVKKNFKSFNDYFSVLGKILAESEEIVNVCVLHPMRSAYFEYQRFPDGAQYNIGELDDAFSALITKLCAKQLAHHYIDETLLDKYGRIEGSSLVVGQCKYDYLILPKLYTMDKTTEKLLHQYINKGGKVLLTSEKPGYLEGEEYTYDYLHSNVTWEEIVKTQPYYCEEEPNIRTAYRKDKQGREFIYAVNLGKETTACFTLKKGKTLRCYDIFNDEYTTIDNTIRFYEGQSYLLYVEEGDEPIVKTERKPLKLKNTFTVCEETMNYLTLDFLRYSIDGNTYSEPLHHQDVFHELLRQRFSGKLYLKYECNVKFVPSVCCLLVEDMNILSVKVNEIELKSCSICETEKTVKKYDIAKLLRSGQNEIIVSINYFQNEQVYNVLFGENITEGLKNCLTYDTSIEAVFLQGVFGVYGDFEHGKKADVLFGKNFYIDKQQKEIQEMITQGYPFFAGDIVLKQTLIIDDVKQELVIDERFHLIDVHVNGRYVGRMMFNRRLDLSNFLHKGKNEIEITLTIGNRNLLGPFHTSEQDWRAYGTKMLLENGYAFLKTIL